MQVLLTSSVNSTTGVVGVAGTGEAMGAGSFSVGGVRAGA